MTVNGIAVAATCRFIPNEPCQPITTPVDACRNRSAAVPGEPCRALNLALTALGSVQPGQACTPVTRAG